MKIGQWILGVGVAAIVGNAAMAAVVKSTEPEIRAETPAPADPLAFFERLVERYRALESYRDTTQFVQVTSRPGQSAERVETQLQCEIESGELEVWTPFSKLRHRLGLRPPMRSTEDVDGIRKRYQLWLAPHMALKFTDKPLEQFRDGVTEGFTATEVGPASIDDKPMVHLELTSGDGLSEDYKARFDLFVDPESMLIERIEGEQRLDDGASYKTTLDIKPEVVEPEPEPAVPWKPTKGPTGGPTMPGGRPAG